MELVLVVGNQYVLIDPIACYVHSCIPQVEDLYRLPIQPEYIAPI